MCDILVKLGGQVLLKIMWFGAEYEYNWSRPWSNPHILNITNSYPLVDIFTSTHYIKFSLFGWVYASYILLFEDDFNQIFVERKKDIVIKLI